jgi:hypothetical protein
MELPDVAALAVDVCEREGIPYFIVGSVASSYYGKGRSTEDVDIVIALSADKLDRLCDGFKSDAWYLSPEAAAEAVRTRGMFNAIHVDSGYKVDFIVLDGTPFGSQRLARRRPAKILGGRTAMVASPEDVILHKLLFYQQGESDKHLTDIANMIGVMGPDLDMGYIREWVDRLGVTREWEQARGPYPGR